MTSPGPADPDERVLVYAPIGRDAELTRDLLERGAIPCDVCQSIAALIESVETASAGALLLTEEALDEPGFPALVTSLEQQPPWSDVPVLLFAGVPGSDMTLRAIRSVETLRNVTLLERPIRVAAVLSTVRAALRGRRRQHQVRDLLLALHRARTEAESANRLKDEFLATLSHELRTPLNAILGWTSMLTRGQIDPGRFPQVFETLDRNAQSQAQLIADVLDVSRIITGKLQLRVTSIDVCELVARAADAVRPAAIAKDIRLNVQETGHTRVQGDAERLQQVFWNLLSNAVKFTPRGGAIGIEIAPSDDHVVIAISDTGVGIAPEFVPFVFDRFRQADQTTTRAHGGLGLGLSIVKYLTELHGGTISASSPGVGQGARFEVRLPALSTGIDIRPGTPVLTDAVRLDGRSILVVDDDESTREVVATALMGAHAEVQTAASAAEARQHLKGHTPALIIADLGMPGEDGFSLIRHLREDDGLRVPAIALSAYADQSSHDAALTAGFDAFVAKPARADALLQMVGALLEDAPLGDPPKSRVS
jgi:signal transduction histidine kinase/ActR/RegA family two-component response regulator